MGLSTHVLDTAHGCPAAGMVVTLSTIAQGSAQLLKRVTLNADGRNPDGLLLEGAALHKGCYRLSFEVAAYFRRKGVTLPEPPFLDVVHIDFGIAQVDQHYHVPLLCSP
ncbi:MAG: hydroxyisourate hydrolase, partial [Burkholderiaceae bacterium]